MPPTVNDICDVVAGIANPKLAENWDNVGLQLGDPRALVKKIMVALDLTPGLYKAAVENSVDMVITHHPPLFNPLKSFDLSKPLPSLLLNFIKSDISILSAHTNLDAAIGGVNDILADIAGLVKRRPIIPSDIDEKTGIGRIGNLVRPEMAQDFIASFLSRIETDTCMIAGCLDRSIQKVALCGGAGASLWPEVIRLNADIFITGEVKHNVAIEAEMINKIVVDAGHWATEHPVVPVLSKKLQETLSSTGFEIDLQIFNAEKPPLHPWWSCKFKNLEGVEIDT